jgi:hypothetical protein
MTTLGKQSPADIRKAKARKPDFVCESCGEEWNAPAHAWWVCRMRCDCGEEVEA